MDDKQSKRIDAAITGLNEWEQEIVLLEVEDVAQGLRIGVDVYGHWDPTNESRWLVKEADEESRDLRVYVQMRRIMRSLRLRRRRRPSKEQGAAP